MLLQFVAWLTDSHVPRPRPALLLTVESWAGPGNKANWHWQKILEIWRCQWWSHALNTHVPKGSGGAYPEKDFKLGCSEIASEALVWLEYLAEVILPFTMIHISHHEALALYTSILRRWVPYRRLPSTSTILYFTLKLVQWSLTGKEVTKGHHA